MRRRLLVLIALLLATPALAQQSGPTLQGWGVRVGLAEDPDQVVAGVVFDLGEIAGDWKFRPDVELGVGDDHVVLAATAPVHYHFEVGADFRPYAGGGLTLAFIDRDLPAPARGDDSDFEVAFKAIGGLEWQRKSGRTFAIELDLVFGDVHDVEVLAVWTF